MDNLLTELLRRTNELVERIEEVSYEELVSLVEFREDIATQVADLQSKVTESQRHLLGEISRYNECIIQRMTQLRDEAASNLRKIHQSKLQKDNYEKYAQSDGILFDYKK